MATASCSNCSTLVVVNISGETPCPRCGTSVSRANLVNRGLAPNATSAAVTKNKPYSFMDYIFAPASFDILGVGLRLFIRYIGFCLAVAGLAFLTVVTLGSNSFGRLVLFAEIALMILLGVGFLLQPLYCFMARIMNDGMDYSEVWTTLRTSCAVWVSMIYTTFIAFAVSCVGFIFSILTSFSSVITGELSSNAVILTVVVSTSAIGAVMTMPFVAFLLSVVSANGEMHGYNPIRTMMIISKLFIPISLCSLCITVAGSIFNGIYFYLFQDQFSAIIAGNMQAIQNTAPQSALIQIPMCILSMMFGISVFKIIAMVGANNKCTLDQL